MLESKAGMCQEPACQVTQHAEAFFLLASHHSPKTAGDSKSFALAKDHKSQQPTVHPRLVPDLGMEVQEPSGVPPHVCVKFAH